MLLTFPRINEFSVKNNSENLNPVQSNGLPSYLLGSYNHPQFGAINSSFVGQLVQQITIIILVIMQSLIQLL